jgi:hypothetical protein
MIRMGFVEGNGEIRNAYTILVGICEVKRQTGWQYSNGKQQGVRV